MLLQQPAELDYRPRRIISLVPSQTELLHALGLETETAGITKFCIHPSAWFTTKQRVGGTKHISLQAVSQIDPDLIIANKEENTKEQVEALAELYPVWVTDVQDLQTALQMISDIGILTGKTLAAQEIARAIEKKFTEIYPLTVPVKTAYLIWRKPYMAAGGGTFIHDMLERCGMQNIFGQETRYPQINIEALKAAHCRLLLLSSEPYPFKQQHIEELQCSLPGTVIMLVDGEMFSWYGSRLLLSGDYFTDLIRTIQRL